MSDRELRKLLSLPNNSRWKVDNVGSYPTTNTKTQGEL
jgi:hypothetical protein